LSYLQWTWTAEKTEDKGTHTGQLKILKIEVLALFVIILTSELPDPFLGRKKIALMRTIDSSKGVL
jgi:hypothetical protein